MADTNIAELLPVTEIQRFCMHDGPGVRTVVFLKGCPLRCEWCHNPETQNTPQQILFEEKKCILCASCSNVCPNQAHTLCDRHIFDRLKCTLCEKCISVCPAKALYPAMTLMSIDAILKKIEADCAFYGAKGGMTLSGGEPLLHGDKACALLNACKKRRISTAIETCGHFNTELLEKVIPITDLFLWDIKDTDSQRHKKFTGVPNELILKNLKAADKLGAKIRLRCILVNKVNTDPEHYKKIAELANTLTFCEGVEIIPYHAYGGSKMLLLGRDDNGKAEWIPPDEVLETAKSVIKNMGANVI